MQNEVFYIDRNCYVIACKAAEQRGIELACLGLPLKLPKILQDTIKKQTTFRYPLDYSFSKQNEAYLRQNPEHISSWHSMYKAMQSIIGEEGPESSANKLSNFTVSQESELAFSGQPIINFKKLKHLDDTNLSTWLRSKKNEFGLNLRHNELQKQGLIILDNSLAIYENKEILLINPVANYFELMYRLGYDPDQVTAALITNEDNTDKHYIYKNIIEQSISNKNNMQIWTEHAEQTINIRNYLISLHSSRANIISIEQLSKAGKFTWKNFAVEIRANEVIIRHKNFAKELIISDSLRHISTRILQAVDIVIDPQRKFLYSKGNRLALQPGQQVYLNRVENLPELKNIQLEGWSKGLKAHLSFKEQDYFTVLETEFRQHSSLSVKQVTKIIQLLMKELFDKKHLLLYPLLFNIVNLFLAEKKSAYVKKINKRLSVYSRLFYKKHFSKLQNNIEIRTLENRMLLSFRPNKTFSREALQLRKLVTEQLDYILLQEQSFFANNRQRLYRYLQWSDLATLQAKIGAIVSWKLLKALLIGIHNKLIAKLLVQVKNIGDLAKLLLSWTQRRPNFRFILWSSFASAKNSLRRLGISLLTSANIFTLSIVIIALGLSFYFYNAGRAATKSALVNPLSSAVIAPEQTEDTLSPGTSELRSPELKSGSQDPLVLDLPEREQNIQTAELARGADPLELLSRGENLAESSKAGPVEGVLALGSKPPKESALGSAAQDIRRPSNLEATVDKSTEPENTQELIIEAPAPSNISPIIPEARTKLESPSKPEEDASLRGSSNNPQKISRPANLAAAPPSLPTGKLGAPEQRDLSPSTELAPQASTETAGLPSIGNADPAETPRSSEVTAPNPAPTRENNSLNSAELPSPTTSKLGAPEQREPSTSTETAPVEQNEILNSPGINQETLSAEAEELSPKDAAAAPLELPAKIESLAGEKATELSSLDELPKDADIGP